MKYTVTVKPNAKHASIEQVNTNELSIKIKSPAKNGRANKELVELLANFLNIPQTHISIARGTTGRKKIIEIS